MQGDSACAGESLVVQRDFISSRLAPELVAVAYDLLVPGGEPVVPSPEPGGHRAPRPAAFRFHQPVSIGGGCT
jgi:hypothetical protein